MAENLEPLTPNEQRVVDALHEARATVRAPHGLRMRIEAQRPSRRTQTRRRVSYGAAAVGALAAAVLALVLILPAGTPGGPSVSQAAAVGALGATAAAPVPDPKVPQKLQTSVGELYFPNWARFRWHATGQRVDKLDGRRAVTVYYDWLGRRIAYTIVAAPALAQPSGAITTVNQTTFRTLTLNGRLVVTWRRSNHTCVLSATGLSARAMQELASWKVPQAAD